MLDIIAHRGFWLKKNHKNTLDAFRLALDNGFGIETDLRDFGGNVVISHDIPTKDCITFEKFIEIVKKYPNQTLALNIKSDGLQKLLNEGLAGYMDYFFFDMSIPDTLGYLRNKLTYYTRYSDLELHPALLDKSAGVWIDNFSSSSLNMSALDEFLKLKKNVVLVSPELHGFGHESYWKELLEYLKLNSEQVQNIGLCTDKPMDAREFFNSVK